MRRRKTSGLFKDKTLVVAVILSVIAIAGLAGVGIYNQTKQEDNNQNLVDLNELPDSLVADNAKDTSTDTKAATTENVQAQNYNDDQNAVNNVMDATDEVNAQTKDSSITAQDSVALKDTSTEDAVNDASEKTTEATKKATATSGKAKDIAVSFTDKSKLTWPITGNVLLNYSMDKTVYFATLNQYKYNPALIIQANEEDKVVSAANGKITSISTKSETGQTVTMDLGNGYTAIYGQLQNISVKEGDTIEKGSLIGYISKPSKYYSVEGTNLYFAMLKDDSPINPMSFLE